MTDLISRADAIGIVLTYFIPRSHTGERGEHEEDFVRMIFKALPSADTVQGEWIHDGQNFKGGLDWCHCSECGYKTSTKGLSIYRYCPSCGAKMCKGGDSE